MTESRKKSLLSLTKSVISIALLVGFLCIQFHSFSHTHLDLFETHNDSHQTKNSSIDGLVISEGYTTLDCSVCVLTKHLNSDVSQYHSSSLPLSLQVLDINQNEPFSNLDDTLFNLRAPPFNIA